MPVVRSCRMGSYGLARLNRENERADVMLSAWGKPLA